MLDWNRRTEALVASMLLPVCLAISGHCLKAGKAGVGNALSNSEFAQHRSIPGVARSHPGVFVADTIRPLFSRNQSIRCVKFVAVLLPGLHADLPSRDKTSPLALQVRANAAFVRKIASDHSLPMNGGCDTCRTSKQFFTWMITLKPEDC